ncbi:MAG: hypothetical protein RLZZ58_2159 [Pseudomonadota bacterium]|jgi:opacity protein-like surface antigen
MKSFIAAAVLSIALITPAIAADETAAPVAAEAAKPAFTTAESTIGDLLANPDAAAVVEKHLPGFSSHPSIGMASGFSLKAVQAFAPDQISDAALAAIDADFAALAAK